MALTVALALALAMAAVVYAVAPLLLGSPAPPLEGVPGPESAAEAAETAAEVGGLRAWAVAAGELDEHADAGTTTAEET